MLLNPQYMIAPSLQEIFVDPSTGLPLANGSVTFYSDVNRSTKKAIFELAGSSPSYTYTQIQNPAPLSAGGTLTDGTNDILPYYYPYNSQGLVELYYIVVKDSGGNTKITRQAYPNFTGNSGSVSNFGYDFVRNGQFTKWSTSTDFADIGIGSSGISDFIADDWYYLNDDANQTIEIKQGEFSAGASPLPARSPYYLQYINTDATSAAQTVNFIQQIYSGVQTLSGEDVTIGLWVNIESISGDPRMSVQILQNFGDGGTPSPVLTPVFEFDAVPGGGWTFVQGTITVPSIVGSAPGPNSFIGLRIYFPLNATAVVDIGNVQFQRGLSLSEFVEKSIDDVSRGTNYQTKYPEFTTGDVKSTIKTVSDTGWLLMDDGTIGSLISGSAHAGIGYKALFNLIWTNVHSTIYAPIYTSAGVISTYGGSAESDWEENKRLSLTRTLGRVLAGAAPSGYVLSMNITSVNTGSDFVVVGDATSFYIGTPVTFTTTGTLPAPFAVLTTYYVEGSSSGQISLSTTLANALAGIAIDITTTGTGDNFIKITYPAHSFGSFFGEESHQTLVSEMPAHAHPGSLASYDANSLMAGADGRQIDNFGTGTNATISVAAQGGFATQNNMQTTSYLNVMIKL